ncbi:MAG: hypothetical protein OXE56_00840 [Gammaproteobacteria bacterium]|nr:hypothetical protein [Gammaproteobacteria bacterium]
MTGKTYETAFNLVLSDALRCRHPQWRHHIQAERTGVIEGAQGLRPDILITPLNSSPVIVETEYYPARTVEQEAIDRLGVNLIQTGQPVEHVFAVRVSSQLSSEPQDKIRDSIAVAEFKFCIYSLQPDGSQKRWPREGWIQGDIDDLATSIEASTLSETLLAASTNTLEKGIAQSAATLQQSQTNVGDLIAERLCQEAGEQTNRMAMAIIANAMTFHSRIEGQQSIPTLSSLSGRTEIVNCWQWIVHEVNYWPIFHIASGLLNIIPAKQANSILKKLMAMTDQLIAMGATQINDLSGRAFQTLISDRKFLATFYTLPASATLLAELAISRLNTDWCDRDEVTALRVADFACGTGALLNAAYHAICSRYRRAGNDDADIHASMIESSLYGCDIMPAATHLTASTLSNAQPGLTYGTTQIATMPYGYDENNVVWIGSLELIEKQETLSLLSLGRKQLSGKASGNRTRDLDVPHESMDVVIMNPPFTRPTNHKLATIPVPSFAGFNTTNAEQKAMSNRLSSINRSLSDKAGDGYAGLSSNFIDLAHAKLKPGQGVLAMVLQATFVQGSGWSNARKLLAKHYEDIAVISIANPGSRNYAFSADTDMGEVLVVAKKKKNTTTGTGKYMFVNLLHRPVHHVAAIETAKSIDKHRKNGTDGIIKLGDLYDNGNCISLNRYIGGCAGLVESGLAKFMEHLVDGVFLNSRTGKSEQFPITRLEELGQPGLSHRNIVYQPNGPFDKVPLRSSVPTYPALWSHDAPRERSFIVKPDSELLVKTNMNEQAAKIWEQNATRLHISLDFRFNSQSLAACLNPEKMLGGTAWPNFIAHDKFMEPIILLWLNSTMGIMAYWWVSPRQQLGRGRMTRTLLPNVAVIDPCQFSKNEIPTWDSLFHRFRHETFLPANEALHDDARIALDNAIFDLLNISQEIRDGFDLIRRQWCNEPSVHGGKKRSYKS